MAFLLIISVSGLMSCSQGTGPDSGVTDKAEDTGNGSDQKPAEAGRTFYVSSEGNDSDPGTAEKPLATFAGAVKAVREYKAGNGLPEGGIEIVFAAGRYMIDKQIVFEDRLPDMMNDACGKNRMRRFHVAVAAVHPNDHGLGQGIVGVFCVVDDSHVINSSFLCSAMRYIVINVCMKKRHTIVYRLSGEMVSPAGRK